MDGRTGFGLALAGIGLFGVWAVVTGRWDAFRSAYQAALGVAPPAGASTAGKPAFGVGGSRGAPAPVPTAGANISAAPTSPQQLPADLAAALDIRQPIGSPAQIGYHVSLGNDGAQLEPFGSQGIAATNG